MNPSRQGVLLAALALAAVPAVVPAGLSAAASSAPAVSSAASGRTVIDAGTAYVALTQEGGLGLALDAVAPGEPADAAGTRYALDDVVLSVPEPAELVVGDHASWQPIADPGDTLLGLPATGAGLRLGVSLSDFPLDENPFDGVVSHSFDLALAHEGPGRVGAVERYDHATGPRVMTWFAGAGLRSEPGYSQQLVEGTRPVRDWYVTEPGLHCLTVTVSGTRVDLDLLGGGDPVETPVGPATAELRLAVGDVADPANAPCGTPAGGEPTPSPTPSAEPTPDPSASPAPTPDPTGEPVPGDLTDPRNNVLLPPEHTDVALREVAGRLELGVHEKHGTVDRWHASENLVIHVSDAVRTTVPPPAGLDYTFIAPAGSTVWRLPRNADGNVYLGVSSESFTPSRYAHLPSLRLESVTAPDGSPAPGHFLLGASQQPPVPGIGGAPWFSTRQGLPQAYPMASFGHSHLTWDFTAQGTYCVRFASLATTTTGQRADDDLVLTFVVGGARYDPASAPTCAQRDVARARSHAAAPQQAPAGVVSRAEAPDPGKRVGFTDLAPRLADGDLRLDLLRGDQRGHGTRYAAADLVLATGAATLTDPGLAGGSPAHAFLPTNGAHDALNLNLTGLDPAAWRGDLTWTLDAVDGPGGVVVQDRHRLTDGRPTTLLSTLGAAPRSTAVAPGGANHLGWWFTAPGRYCVRTTLSGTTADGETLSAATTLTIAAGVDPADVSPCTRSGEPTPTPTAGPSPTPSEPGPGTSGRAVLDRGHVDVLARVGAGSLDVVVRDDRTVPATEHDASDVTFDVPPAARVTVPADRAYGFLGEAGTPVWVLPETQVSGMVWPGWSLEAAAGARAPAVRWTLRELDGPGGFALFDSGGDAWGAPRVLLGKDAASFTFDEHGHGSWAFGAAGVYCLDLGIAAVDAGGQAVPGVADAATLLFAVGVDAGRVTEEHCGLTAEEVGAVLGGGGPSPTASPSSTPGTAGGPGASGAPSAGGPNLGNGPGAGGPGGAGPGAGGPGAFTGPGGTLASTGFGPAGAVLAALSLVAGGLTLLVSRRRAARAQR